MSARTVPGPGLCLLGAFLCFASISCFAMKTYTPEEATTRFTSEARLEKVLQAAVNALDANDLAIASYSRTKVTAVKDADGARRKTDRIYGDVYAGSSNVLTIFYVTLTPKPGHTDVVINVEKRKSKIYSSDIKLMRKVAAAMAEALGEEISTEESKEA